MASGIIFQPLIGKLLDLSWDGTMINGVAAYSSGNYFFALATIPLSLVLAAGISLTVKELYPKETV